MKCVPAFVLALLFAVQVSANNVPVKVEFIDGSLGLAIQKAGQEGKLLFVEFGAKWCMPCRFMEQNTFRDQEVISYMDANYVPVKIDIDDFDGFAYKQKYNVEALPTFLIMNSSGKILDRHEQSMAPSNLIGVLKSHNLTRNRTIVPTELSPFEVQQQLHEAKRKRTNINPHQASNIVPAETIEEPAPSEATKEEPTTTIPEVVETKPVIVDTQEESPYQWAETVEIPLNQFGDADIEVSEEFLWEEEYVMEEATASKEEVIQRNQEQLHRVQPKITFYTTSLNKFADKSSADAYVRTTSALFLEDTHIFEQNVDGVITYEVCLGSFATKSSADQFIEKLNVLGMNGTSKEVSR